MLNIAEERLNGGEVAEIAVIDVDNREESNRVVNRVKRRFGVSPVCQTPVSPVIGTHAGPGTVGLGFYSRP
jgi:fatty acid-binding protein DegV